MNGRFPVAPNDLEDIAHSCVAVSYSEIILTERSVAELPNRPAVQSVIAPKKCRVVGNVEDAHAGIAEILYV